MPSRNHFARLEVFCSSYWLSALTFLAFLLRAVPLTRQTFWWDEGYSIFIASRPATHIIGNVVGDHPPGYFLLLHFFARGAGYSPLALRLPSVLAGVLAVVLIYQVARRLMGHRVGLLAALLLAISPFHIDRSQDARMYTLMILLTLLSLYFMLSLLQPARMGKSGILWAGYIIAAAASIFVHYFAALFIIAQTAFVLVSRRGGRFRIEWLCAQAAILATLAPWFAYQAPKIWRYVNEKVDIEQTVGQGFIPFWRNYLHVVGQGYFFSGWATAIVFGVLVVGLLARRRRPWMTSVSPFGLCLSLFLLPVTLGFLINIRWPSGSFPRLLSPTLTPLLILVAAGLVGLDAVRPRLTWLALFLLMAGSAGGLYGYYQQTIRIPQHDYRPIIREIKATAGANDAILLEYPWEVGYFISYAPELLAHIYFVTDDFPKPSEETQRTEALRAIWEERNDVREAYSLGNGWGPDRWLEAMEDWWSKTPEAAVVKGDPVSLAKWNYGYLPSMYKVHIDEIMQQHGRLWYPAIQTLGDTSDRYFDRYLSRAYKRLYAKDFGYQRLILVSLPAKASTTKE